MFLHFYPSVILFGKIASVWCYVVYFFLLDHWTFQRRSAPSQLGWWLERHVYSLRIIFDGWANLFLLVLLIKLKPKYNHDRMSNNTLQISGDHHAHPLRAGMFFFPTAAVLHIKSQLSFECSPPQPSWWRGSLLWKGTIPIYFIAKAEAFLQLKTPYGEHSTAKFLSIKLNRIQRMWLPWLQCWPKCAKRNVLF